MSSKRERAPVAMPAERARPRSDLGTQGERGGPQGAKTLRRLSVEMSGLAAATVATIVMYVLLIVHPVAHEPLNVFLTTVFGRGNTAIWPMQLVWYASAAAIIGLAFWPRRRASQLICLLAAACFVWVGIVFFGVIDSGVSLAWLWVAVFILEAILLLVAGIVRRDLVFAPRWNLSSVLGAVFLCYAIVVYPLIEMLGGQPLRESPLFGLAPCVTAFFAFGLLLWARPPAPRYVLLIPLAWALNAAPGNIAMGHVPDFPLILVSAITAGLLIWRDRTSSWQTVGAGFVLTWMIVWSGHDDVLIGTALVLAAVTLAQAIWSDNKLLHANRPPQPGQVLTPYMKLKVLVGSGDKIGRFTLPFLLIGVILNMLFPAFFYIGGPPVALTVISLLMLIPGITIWIWSVILIVTKVPQKKLITNGPYSLVKHPLYTGVAFLVVPWIGFLLNTWLGVLIGITLYAGSRLFSPEEEASLSKTFGPAWDAYRKQVKIPWL
jgi:protein-S-isoprenylcysteine O-methyltransferase Ste14